MMIRDCVTCVYFVESRVHSFSLSTLCGCWVVPLHIDSLCDVGCYTISYIFDLVNGPIAIRSLLSSYLPARSRGLYSAEKISIQYSETCDEKGPAEPRVGRVPH